MVDFDYVKEQLYYVLKQTGGYIYWSEDSDCIRCRIQPHNVGFTVNKDDDISTVARIVSETIHNLYHSFMFGRPVIYRPQYGYKPSIKIPTIDDVIFNEPATIVKWSDGTKTVVKVQNDEEYDAEKGLAMCIAKKAMGNKGSYYNQIKKYVEAYENSDGIYIQPLAIDVKKAVEALRDLKTSLGTRLCRKIEEVDDNK